MNSRRRVNSTVRRLRGIRMTLASSIVGKCFGGLGIVCACVIVGCQSSPKNTAPVPTPTVGSSGQVKLHFKGFQQAKDLLAVFELTNETHSPILYEAYSFTNNVEKTNFCQLAAKQTDLVKQRTVSDCRYASNIALVTLDPGATVSFAAPKWETKETLNLPNDAPEIATKVGFEIFVGDQRRKQIVWSDTIVFPKTISIASQ